MKQNMIELLRKIKNPHFQIFLTITDRTSQSKISKDTVNLKNTINQLDLIDIYRIHHPTTAKCTSLQVDTKHFTKTDNILGHEPSISKSIQDKCKYKRPEIIQNIFSEYKRIKMKITSISGKYPKKEKEKERKGNTIVY